MTQDWTWTGTAPDTMTELNQMLNPRMKALENKLASLSDLGRVVVTDRKYGAVGDGLTDDTAAIQAAWDAASGGDEIFYPAGSYSITTLTIPAKILNHVGPNSYIGPGAQITGSGAITIDTPAATASRGTTFRNLYILNTAVGGTALRIRNGGLVLRDMLAEHSSTGGLGIETISQFGLNWTQVFISAGSGGTAWKSLPDGGNGGINVLFNNVFTNIVVSGQGGAGAGVSFKGGTNAAGNTFVNLDIENVTTALDIDTGQSNTFIGTHIESADTEFIESDTSRNIHISPQTRLAHTISRLSIMLSTRDDSVNADAQALGRWTTPTFADGDFLAVGGGNTWTLAAGDVDAYQYMRTGDKTMTVNFYLSSTTVGGTPTTLTIAIPNSYVAADSALASCYLVDNGGTAETGVCKVDAAGTVIEIEQIDGAAFGASTNTTDVRGQITFEIQ